MLIFGSIISGSSGNATIISDGHTNILTDCGMSGKGISESLEKLDIPIENIDGVLITHEHIDHTRGVGIIARRYGLKIYASEGTLSSIDSNRLDDSQLICINQDCDFEIGTIGIRPFSIPHDAAQPFGFTYFADNKKLALATDIGETNEYIYNNIKGSDAVILESNHDVEMLMYGPYPYSLKQRILSSEGHLSNESAANMAVRLASSGTQHIMLGHLSEKNNLPDIAYMTTANALKENGISASYTALAVANRYTPTVITNI